jgi:hypothetical protein
MPRYDIQCELCGHVREIYLRYEQKDSLSQVERFTTECPQCELIQPHFFKIPMTGVEWKIDGTYGTDNADQFTKYARDHFADSGDISEKRARDRKLRRGY